MKVRKLLGATAQTFIPELAEAIKTGLVSNNVT